MRYITESLADALLRRRHTEEPAPEPTSKKVNEEVEDEETPLPDDVVVADIEDSNVDIEDDKVEEQEVKESVEGAEETDVESKEEQTEAPVDESVEEEVEIIGESINYKKIANDILDDWDDLVKKGGSNNMKKAVMAYVKKNKNKIDFEDFDYNKFDKEAQSIIDKGEASANKNYKKGSVPWYDMDAQMGLGNSDTVDDGDWYDWFDDALNESTEEPTPESSEDVVNEDEPTPEPTRKFYSIDEDRWITIKGTHVLVDDNGGIKNEKLKDKIESTSKKSE